MTGRWTRVRMAFFGLVLLVLAGFVGRQAWKLQIRDNKVLSEYAQGNYLKELELAPQRGRILDRNGTELASTIQVDSLFCNPRQLRHVPDAATKLSKALKMPVKDVQKIIDQDRFFAWLRRAASADESKRVMALKLRGVGVRKEPRRVYPYNDLASTVLGHSGIDGRGLEGVEKTYEKYLHGKSVQLMGIRDAYGRDLLVEGAVDTTATAGQDIVLSLDKYLTFVMESELAAAVEKHKAKAAMALMIDPRTGEVLAMANVPTYNPNDPRDALLRGAKNRAITDTFEPGSTMKTFTFAAAFDADKLKTTDLFDCQMGSMTIGPNRIRDDHPKGILTAAEVFKHSSNIGTVKIARRLGKEDLHAALLRFGFGKRAGIGLEGEVNGIVRAPSGWREIDFATHAFGQGLTVTPLQLATGFATIASGGIYRAPRLALKVVHPDGRVEALPRPPTARPDARAMSEAAAKTMLQVMQGVTEKGGTATAAAIDGYPVAGKTGTAQKVTDGRYGDKRVSSFVGIVPADNPRLVIAVVVDEPGGPVAYGGLIAAPAFKAIAEAALRYLGVPPSQPLAADTKKKTGKPAGGEVSAAAVPQGAVDDLKEGLGSDLPLAVEDDALDAGEGGRIADESSEETRAVVIVPNFSGMSVGQAIRAARRAGVEIVPEGSGIAVAQTPVAGALFRGSTCRVAFRPGS